jgi:hypothetical protein
VHEDTGFEREVLVVLDGEVVHVLCPGEFFDRDNAVVDLGNGFPEPGVVTAVVPQQAVEPQPGPRFGEAMRVVGLGQLGVGQGQHGCETLERGQATALVLFGDSLAPWH